MSHSPYTRRSLYHGWLPKYLEIHQAFLQKHVTSTIGGPKPGSDPKDWVKDFINAIKTDPVMGPLYPLLFEQVNKDPQWEITDEKYVIRNINHLQNSLDSVVQDPPEVFVAMRKEGDKEVEIGEPIGIPIYLLFDPLMNTTAAYDLFRTEGFNKAVRELLTHWGDYLKDPNSGSNSTLTTAKNGWFGCVALPLLEKDLTPYNFEQTYGVDPKKAQDTYKSWDAFFTRGFKDSNIDKLRPVTPLPGYKKVNTIYNPCESVCFRISPNVKLNDTFWLKTQNYSVYDMLAGGRGIAPKSLSGYADKFVGGSVYQSTLYPQDYHHWHSPIKGTVVEARVVPGTYYAVLPDEGAPANDDLKEGDPHGAMVRCQPWISTSSARSIFIIKADPSSDLEYAAFIGIGLAEVSTIEIEKKFDQPRVEEYVHKPVEAGEHLGMFHFGGSSQIFILKAKEGKKVVFKDKDGEKVETGQHHWVRSIIGRVE